MAKLTNEEVIASLKEMTILELNDLVKAIEEEFGVTAAAPVAVAAVADAAPTGPSEVTVTLTDVELLRLLLSRLFVKSLVLDWLKLKVLLTSAQVLSKKTSNQKKLKKSRRNWLMPVQLLKLNSL